MKAHLSVWMVYVRSSLYLVLGALLGMALAEGALCAAVWMQAGERGLSLEHLFDSTHPEFVFRLTLLLVVGIVCRVGCAFGSKTGYTLCRLRISGPAQFFWQSLSNTLFFFLLWAVQAAVAFGICRAYLAAADPAQTGPQTVFLALHRVDFLHGLLPVQDEVSWAANIITLLGLGVACAHFSFWQSRGKRGLLVLYMAAAAVVLFPRSTDVSGLTFNVILIELALITIGAAIAAQRRHENEKA